MHENQQKAMEKHTGRQQS